MLIGYDHTDPLRRHDAPRPLNRLLKQCHVTIQRAVLLGHMTTMSVSRQSREARAIASSKHDGPDVPLI
jgi:hypothetical protein